MPTPKTITLPKDRAEIQYYIEDGKVKSKIEMNCGCIWIMTWAKSGTLIPNDGIENEILCSDHDPTLDDDGEVVEF